MKLEVLYANRFSAADRAWKVVVWQILWDRVLSAHVKQDDVFVDLGAGFCELVNAAKAKRRIAVDLNPRTKEFAAPGVEVRSCPAEKLDFLADGEADVVMSSNFLEHLPTKAAVQSVLEEAHRVLKPGGRLVLIGPNVRIVPHVYWDYFDHHVALSERSVAEALSMIGFELVHVEPRFLPYTVKSRLPRWRALVHAWITFRRIAGRLLGAQFYVVARKP